MINQAARPIPISDALSRIAPSATVALTEEVARLRKSGREIIGLGAGEPDFDTPSHIQEAAIKAIRDGKTRYTAPGGIAELKAAIVQKFEVENGLAYDAANVIVSTGGKQVLFNALLATLNPGDEVIVPAPYWVSYPDIVRFAGGVPVIVHATAATGFKVRPEDLRSAVTEKTRWVILNSPNNPTGAVYSATELENIAGVLAPHPNVLVLADDIYEHITFGVPSRTLASVVPEMKERTLIVNGVSKAYAMTGWRLGYGAGPPDLIRAMVKLQGQSTTNACTISQWAAIAALTGPKAFRETWRDAYARRSDLVKNAMSGIEGVSLVAPEGAFYAFPDISGCLKAHERADGSPDDVGFASDLLRSAGVAMVPGTAFGAPGHLRLSFAVSEKVLAESMDRFRAFCASKAKP